MNRNIIMGALALTMLSTGAMAQTWSSQTRIVEGAAPAPAPVPGVTSRSVTETTQGYNGTETRRQEYQSNPSTGVTRSSSEHQFQGPDGTINSSSVRREERVVTMPPPPPMPVESTTTTTTTTVR